MKIRKFNDITGQIFTRLTVIEYAFSDSLWQPHWVVKCSCDGKEFIIKGNWLKTGNTKSCGCLQKEIAKKVNTKHGFAKGSKSQRRFYQIWQSMKDRCYNKKCGGYQWYGARGIKVCSAWLGKEGFINFRDALWTSYLKHIKEFGENNTTIGRLDVDGNYEMTNVRWETNDEQSKNTRTFANTKDYSGHRYWRKLIQGSISQCIKTYKRIGSTNAPIFIKYIGCSFLDFKTHMESLWTERMSWDNYGKGKDKWNVDHIIGCNNFDLSKEEERLVCFNYKNLRPMWEPEHKKKSTLRTEYQVVNIL